MCAPRHIWATGAGRRTPLGALCLAGRCRFVAAHARTHALSLDMPNRQRHTALTIWILSACFCQWLIQCESCTAFGRARCRNNLTGNMALPVGTARKLATWTTLGVGGKYNSRFPTEKDTRIMHKTRGRVEPVEIRREIEKLSPKPLSGKRFRSVRAYNDSFSLNFFHACRRFDGHIHSRHSESPH